MKANLKDIQTIYSELPQTYIYENVRYDNYHLLTEEEHYDHGWRDVEIPVYNENTQKLSNEYLLKKDKIKKDIIELTAEELAEIENKKIDEYRHKIYDKTESLLKSALERSLGKENQGLTLIQLQNLQQNYEMKKNYSQNILQDVSINEIASDLLFYEIDKDFGNGKLDATIIEINKLGAAIDLNLTDIKKYASLILFKYFYGNEMYNDFKAMVENFRSKLLTNLDYKEFTIIDARFEIVNQINNETTIDEIMIINTQFNAL